MNWLTLLAKKVYTMLAFSLRSAAFVEGAVSTFPGPLGLAGQIRRRRLRAKNPRQYAFRRYLC
jgi:hypothetical protein